jgi:hypothetical protein
MFILRENELIAKAYKFNDKHLIDKTIFSLKINIEIEKETRNKQYELENQRDKTRSIIAKCKDTLDLYSKSKTLGEEKLITDD